MAAAAKPWSATREAGDRLWFELRIPRVVRKGTHSTSPGVPAVDTTDGDPARADTTNGRAKAGMTNGTGGWKTSTRSVWFALANRQSGVKPPSVSTLPTLNFARRASLTIAIG